MNIKLFKKAILLIHGFAGGSYDYNSLNNDLELYNSFDVFTFTLPGHERMIIDKVTRKDWIKKAEDELEKIINSGYSDVYIIGHSMGGVIASYLASKYKEVKKLVLAAPAFRYFSFKNDKLDVVQSLKKVPKLFKEYPSEEILSRFFKVPITTIKEFMKLVEEHTNDIQKITCPTLILWGTKDEIVPKDSVNYVFDNISSKSVTLFEIKTLTHDLFINDRYEDVKKIITFFLRKNPKRKKEKFKI